MTKYLLLALAFLAAPLLSAQAPAHTVTLTWQWAQCTTATPPVCNGLATGFTVFKATATGTTCPAVTTFTQLATTTPTITAALATYTYVDSNTSPSTSILTEGVTYCYAVTATDAAGASPDSPIAQATVPFSVPDAPLSSAASAK